MSWKVSATGRRFAFPGEAKAAFVQARQSLTEPAARQILTIHQAAVDEAVSRSPHDCDITITSYGHFNNDGTGSADLHIEIAAHLAPLVAADAPGTPITAGPPPAVDAPTT